MEHPTSGNNVIDLFTRRPFDDTPHETIVRIAPELDGISLLYQNDLHPNRLFTMNILCWALMDDGHIDAMVPWLKTIVPAHSITDPLGGHFEGFFDHRHNRVFYEAPDYKAAELESAYEYFIDTPMPSSNVLQEIPDTIGTHAILTHDRFKTVELVGVTSWRLLNSGEMQGMIAEQDLVKYSPVLVGDASLRCAQNHNDFHYFFQYDIANQLKRGDPDAIAAFSQLIDE